MEIKKLLLALFLSFVFIITWNQIFPPIEAEEEIDKNVPSVNNDNTAEEPLITETTLESMSDVSSAINVDNISQAAITVKTSLLNLELINGATSISNLKIIEQNDDGSFKHKGVWVQNGDVYDVDSPVELVTGGTCNPCLLIDDEVVRFVKSTIESVSSQQIITSVAETNNIIKKTMISDDSYTLYHTFQNLPNQKDVVLLWDTGISPSEQFVTDDVSYFSVYAQNEDSYEEEYLSSVGDEKPITYQDNVGWAGLKSKYFIKAITNDNYNRFKADQVVFDMSPAGTIDGVEWFNTNMKYHYRFSDIQNNELKVRSYIGPIDLKHLNQNDNKHLSQLFGFGWFFIGYLAKGIMWLLTGLYSIIPNYGVVCILFAFIIRFFTGPLTKKSFLSNQKMQAIQPKLKKIQEKYKDDSAKLNQEIMGLYQKEGVNPLGGCLPILIQMPLLIALFQVFRKTIEFRGASFLPFWITDLSQPDVVLQFDFLKNIWGLSFFFGHGIALLPIIMGVVMFLNMKMTATNNINPSQTSTMYIMNGFFILLFNTFPSGLNLYYTVYNILNFLQQRKLQKLNT